MVFLDDHGARAGSRRGGGGGWSCGYLVERCDHTFANTRIMQCDNIRWCDAPRHATGADVTYDHVLSHAG